MADSATEGRPPHPIQEQVGIALYMLRRAGREQSWTRAYLNISKATISLYI